MQGLLEGQQRDQRGHESGCELSGRMTVRECRGLGAQLDRLLRDPVRRHALVQTGAIQPDRRDAHRSTAALAGIARAFAERSATAQCIDDRDSRHTRGEQGFLTHEPAVEAGRDRRGFALGMQPAQIGVTDDGWHVDGPRRGAARVGAQQPLRSEHRHLRIVGDRPITSEDLLVAVHAAWPEAGANLRERHELDRRAQGIPGCPADQAAAPAATAGRRGLRAIPAGDGLADRGARHDSRGGTVGVGGSAWWFHAAESRGRRPARPPS